MINPLTKQMVNPVNDATANAVSTNEKPAVTSAGHNVTKCPPTENLRNPKPSLDNKAENIISIVAGKDKLKKMVSIVEKVNSKITETSTYTEGNQEVFIKHQSQYASSKDVLQSACFNPKFLGEDSLSRLKPKMFQLRQAIPCQYSLTQDESNETTEMIELIVAIYNQHQSVQNMPDGGLGCYGNCAEKALYYIALHNETYPDDITLTLGLDVDTDSNKYSHRFVAVFKPGQDIYGKETIIVDPWANAIFKMDKLKTELYNPGNHQVKVVEITGTNEILLNSYKKKQLSIKHKDHLSIENQTKNMMFTEASEHPFIGYARVNIIDFLLLPHLGTPAYKQLPENKWGDALTIAYKNMHENTHEYRLVVCIGNAPENHKIVVNLPQLIYPNDKKHLLVKWLNNWANVLFNNALKKKQENGMPEFLQNFTEIIDTYSDMPQEYRSELDNCLYFRFIEDLQPEISDNQYSFPSDFYRYLENQGVPLANILKPHRDAGRKLQTGDSLGNVEKEEKNSDTTSRLMGAVEVKSGNRGSSASGNDFTEKMKHLSVSDSDSTINVNSARLMYQHNIIETNPSEKRTEWHESHPEVFALSKTVSNEPKPAHSPVENEQLSKDSDSGSGTDMWELDD
nr:hypothetical protein [Endozoicomonas sp.]